MATKSPKLKCQYFFASIWHFTKMCEKVPKMFRICVDFEKKIANFLLLRLSDDCFRYFQALGIFFLVLHKIIH